MSNYRVYRWKGTERPGILNVGIEALRFATAVVMALSGGGFSTQRRGRRTEAFR